MDTAAGILGEAFADYPVFARTLRDPLRRHAALPLLWRAEMRGAFSRPGTHLDLAERDGVTVGAALWTTGGNGGASWLDVLRHGYLRFGMTAGNRDGLRLMRLQDQVDGFHRAVVREPHLYLLAIGALGRSQGQGVGSELLQRGLARADEQQLPVYLETYLEANIRLYRRHGFLVVREDPVDQMTCTSMLRPVQ